MGKMHVMNSKGDTKIVWRKENPDEVQVAREAFDAMMAKTPPYQAFRVRTTGGRGERIAQFDPAAEAIIFAPHVAGG